MKRPFVITVDFKDLKKRDPNALEGCRILDIGCGEGRHTCEGARIKGALSVGGDRSYRDVRETGEHLKYLEAMGECRGVWRVLATDIYHLPFSDNFFDLVICSEVLEHLPNPKTAVWELLRVLKPGKNLAISVPRRFPEAICWALSHSYHNTLGGHVRIFREKELVSLVEKSGAKHYRKHFAHSLHSPYWWLKCLVGPERDDSFAVNLYKRFLEWDILQKPLFTRLLERLLNPFLGKSVVFYFRKQD